MNKLGVVAMGLIVVSIIIGCKKDNNDPADTNNNTGTNTGTFALGSVEAKLDGTLNLFQTQQNGVDTMDNYYDVADKHFQFFRGKGAQFPALGVAWVNANLDNISVPFTWTEDTETSLHGAAQFSYLSGAFDFPWVLDGSKDWSVTLDSKTGDVLEGTFNGWLTTTDLNFNMDSMYVTEGRFKVAVVRR